MTHRGSYRVAVLGAVAVAAWLASVRPSTGQSLEQHVELSVQLLELSVAEWRERVALPAAAGTDGGAARTEALAALEKKYKSERARLYEIYFTTAAAQLTFYAKHASQVDAYLEEYPEVKDRIDALTLTVRSLIEQEESRTGVPQGVPQ